MGLEQRGGNAEVPLVPQPQVETQSEKRNMSESTPLVGKWEVQGLATKVIASILLGMICIVASLVGLSIFLEADYFHDPGPYAQNSWCGYTARTFWGLVAFACLPTVGFTLVFSALSAALRFSKGSNFLIGIGSLFFAFFCLSMGSIGMVWGNETMKCFGVFCVDMSKYVEIPNARPEAGIGFLSVVGIAAFSSLVPISLVMIVVIFRHLAPASFANRLDGKKNGRQSTVIPTLVLFVLVGLLGVTTLYIPNSWEYFVAARIAKNAKLIVTTDANVCNTYYNAFTCSEVPWAFMQTSNWQVSTNLNLKLYPSNLIFYSYLLITIAFVGVARHLKVSRLYLKRHVLGTRLTFGEFAMVLFTIIMVALFFTYWIHDHNYNGYWQGGTDPGILPSERWARTSGQVAVIFLSLLFFPASRNSVVHRIFGTSWEASLWAHRVLGYCMMGATLAHMISWYKFYDIKGFFPRDIFDIPMKLPTSIDNFTVPLSSLASFTMLLCMGIFALEPVRRRFFELFYYTHIFAAYLLIPVILWHAAAGWEYLLPGLTVWFVDRIMRMYRGGIPVHLIDCKVIGDVTQLTFRHSGLVGARPGQYVFINVPEISLFQWHPFTLSTSHESSESGCHTLHIKSMGIGTWTWQLLELARSEPKPGGITIAVDGPCGSPFEMEDFKHAILVAGGIGITPCASIFSELKLKSDISSTLLWTVRESELLHAFSQHLSIGKQPTQAINGSLGSMENVHQAKVFVTRSRELPLNELGVSIVTSRPRLEEELSAAAAGFNSDDVIVFVCGPDAMVAECFAIANAKKFHFHSETFLL